MPYTCIVADDDSMERELLVSLLEKIPAVRIVASCRSRIRLASQIGSGLTGVLYVLDEPSIGLHQCDNDRLLKTLQHPPAFIFITSYPDYAAESYELDAVDYIVKPVTLTRLTRSVNKAMEYLTHKQLAAAQPGAERPVTPGEKGSDSFYIKETKGYTRLLYNQVVYIESMGDFCRICTTESKIHIVLVGLKNIETQLPEDSFIRVQKQFIINIHHIRTITSDTIEMTNGHEVLYSAYYKQQLLDKTVNMKLISRFG